MIGSHADIQAVQLEDVKSFFKTFYAPNNASIAIVGDFNPAEVKVLVEKYFGTFKHGPAIPKLDVTTPPITSERRAVVPDRIELPKVYFAWITPSIYQPGDAEADLPARILRRRQVEPALQEARVRVTDRAGRHGLAILAGARIVLQHRGDCASGTHG